MSSPSKLLSWCIKVVSGNHRLEEKLEDVETNNTVSSDVCNGNRIGGSVNTDLLGMTNH